MDSKLTPNFENLVYLYACKENHLFKVIDDDFFKNKHIRNLYKLTRDFYYSFKVIPFDMDDRSTEQIEELAYENEDIKKASTLSDKENVDTFLNNVRNVFSTDEKKYAADWLENAVTMWIQWENSQKGYKLAIEHSHSIRNKNVGPDKVAAVIKECQDIIISRTSITFDNDLGSDFMNPESHIQTAPDDLFGCGFPNLNKWACEDGHGGFEAGTLTILVGESNIGKCSHEQTMIKLKNKKTGIITEIQIGEFYNKLRR